MQKEVSRSNPVDSVGVNPYATPQADLNPDDYEAPDFYVVSIKKFTVLFFATVGLYSVYWFYKNWQYYKEKHDAKMWPIARGIFNIFFAHKLFGFVEDKLESVGKGGTWKPSGLATSYVIFTIFSNILDRLANKEVGSPLTDLASLLMLIPVFFVLKKAQEKINLSQNDPDGTTNKNFTAANWICITLGGLLWLLIAFGLAFYYPPFAEWFNEV